MRRAIIILTILAVFAVPAAGQVPANLLRNARFQDDWLTLLPENKNHNWNYATEFYHRRDYNPDGWALRGNWQWLDADAPWGRRRLLFQAPEARAAQTVNWGAVHDPNLREGFPDAGGYPRQVAVTSKTPERLVRDLLLRVRVKGQAVPANAGAIEVSLGARASAPLPAGTYDWRWVEAKLPAAAWLKTAKPGANTPLPALAEVVIHYKAAAGRIEVAEAQLTAAAPAMPNLLANGGFEHVDKDGYPTGWSKPQKYRYFPPGYYYLFNTWHNGPFDNRGPVGADNLVVRAGSRSLKMIVAAGDEKAVVSDAIALNQKEARLLEASAWVKTDKLCMLQLDAVNEKGERLDCFNFIHKMPVSIGSDEWRLVRQIFRPRAPVQSVRLMLCARGVNGYTLGGTTRQPQNNVVGTVWWDNVTLHEPESSPEELKVRGVQAQAAAADAPTRACLAELGLGDPLLGENLPQATLVNPGLAGTFRLRWDFTSPSGKKTQFTSAPQRVAMNGRASVRMPYVLTELCPSAYTEYRGTLTLLDEKDKAIAATDLWFGTWTTPVNIAVGATYLRPDQKQFVRLNLGLSSQALAQAAAVRLEVIRKATGAVLKTTTVPATPAALLAQRRKIPVELRDDFHNLLLADLDVSFLPLQPFADPQRNWFIRATVQGAKGNVLAATDSVAFCRLAHQAKQPAIKTVTIDKDNLLFVNGAPWLPWGVAYGFNAVYDGPADSGKYRDLHNLPVWNLYDRHGLVAADRSRFDLNCMRYVAGAVTPAKTLEDRWAKDNLYCSSAFAIPAGPPTSLDALIKGAGGKAKLDAYTAFVKTAPMVVSVSPGSEEAFGAFVPLGANDLKGMAQAVDNLRKATGKPVMVGHGGYWNRFEFEKVPFFDIYDPETEPLYPAPLHTDLMPLIAGKAKVAWLRPQMYENVPYERWRYHTWVELMRGARGWQIAHGPGDASTFRGLHAELESIKPALYSTDRGPKVRIEPWVEHWSRRHQGKLYIIAATTHGLTLGNWRWDDAPPNPPPAAAGRARVTGQPHEWRQEDNGNGLGQKLYQGPRVHSIQWLPDARSWPAGTKLVQWVCLDAKSPPTNLALLVKAEGRFNRAASWGKFDAAAYQKDPALAHWFLRALYRHASGFLGWDDKLVAKALAFVPAQSADLGALPKGAEWVKLEVPLEKIGAADALLDGIGFLHDAGRVWWGRTALRAPDGTEAVIWGDTTGPAPSALARTKIAVAGLKAGTKVRARFEDRELTAENGHFLDDFRGVDLYQRYGGGPYTGYGDTPVALHIYEVPSP